MLAQIYTRALKTGGANMPVAKYAKVFGNDTALRRNVLRACSDIRYGAAIVAGTVGDHRVFESLNRMGEGAAHIVLALESRLGRRLCRARAQQLCTAYLRIVERRSAAADANRTVIRLRTAGR